MNITCSQNDSVLLMPRSSEDELIVAAIVAVFAKGGSIDISANGLRGLSCNIVGSSNIDSEASKRVADAIDVFEM